MSTINNDNAVGYPGITIKSAVISPTIEDIFFIDDQNRIVKEIEFGNMNKSISLIKPEDLEIIEKLKELPIVRDKNGNIFYELNLDNGIVLNSAYYTTGEEIKEISRINDNSILYFFIIASLIIIIMVCLFTINTIKKKQKETIKCE